MLVVGCGNGEHRVPVACFDTNLSKALVSAPGAVRLEGGTKLSDCFTRAAQPAEIQQVAAVFIATASRLGDAARARPHSPATTQLGYLIGAVRHGTSRTKGIHYETARRIEQELIGAVRHGTSHTQGIHYETARRIEQELIGVNTRAPEFVTGEKAGEQTG